MRGLDRRLDRIGRIYPGMTPARADVLALRAALDAPGDVRAALEACPPGALRDHLLAREEDDRCPTS
jgi:hypothetical protein